MTPRTVVHGYPQEVPLREIGNDGQPFSRVLLYDGTIDNVTGYVLRDEVLGATADGKGDDPARTLVRDVLTVPDMLPLPRLFDRLLDRREHLALVVGEYGGTAGVVSMEDVIETLLGLEIVDESDHQHDMQEAAREKWLERAERLGIRPNHAAEDTRQLDAERDAAVKLGLTGGAPPKMEG